MRNRTLTVSNFLSVSRILIVAPIAWLLATPTPGSRVWALILIMVAMLTDLLDGMLARKLNEVTELGKVIDPLADKIAAAAIVLILAIRGMIPIWFLVLILLRDIVILLCGVYIRRTRGILLQSNIAGKWAITLVAFYVLSVIFGEESLKWLEQTLQIASVILLLASTVLYGQRFLALVRE